MTNGIPITNYQVGKIKQFGIIFAGILVFTLIAGNIYNTVIKDGISVNKDSYMMRDGYPFFTSQKDYIELLRSYPHDPGVKFTIHKMRRGESFWNVCQRYNTDIDTLIAANPFLTSLNTKSNTEIVVPAEKGVLFAFNDITDVWRMSRSLDYNDKIEGDYLPHLLKLISNDDVRFVFFRDKYPVMVNPSLEKLYSYHNIFREPVKGHYTSMFGDRVDPFYHEMAFHNGLDIQARYGTPIKPAREGMISFSGWRDGYGKTIEIQHYDGYTTLYAHCSELNVKPGQWVTKDTVIAHIGSTGRSTGPHLHFSVMHHGRIINPLILVW